MSKVSNPWHLLAEGTEWCLIACICCLTPNEPFHGFRFSWEPLGYSYVIGMLTYDWQVNTLLSQKKKKGHFRFVYLSLLYFLLLQIFAGLGCKIYIFNGRFFAVSPLNFNFRSKEFHRKLI